MSESLAASANRWKKAVVHLECMGDSIDRNVQYARSEDIRRRLESGEISGEEYVKEDSRGIRDVRQQGTALFVNHADQNFLVTARHVIWDKVLGERELANSLARAEIHPEPLRQFSIIDAHRRSLTQVFPFICRVPTFDESLSRPDGLPADLMNLSGDWHCEFSEPALDLAVISIGEGSEFSRDLKAHHYEAIPSEDFSNGPSHEGVDVFTVGFPGATAVLGKRGLDSAHLFWGSNDFSLPTFAFGKVSMVHEHLDSFWCDLSIYPGNSGGPVVENDRLVGIVSGQPVIPLEGDASGVFGTRIPFANVIKAKHLIPLMEARLERDRPNARNAAAK